MKISIASKVTLLTTMGQITACQKTIESTVGNNSSNISQAVFRIAADTVPCSQGGLVGQSVKMRRLVVNDGIDHQEGVSRIIKIERTQICDPDAFTAAHRI